MKDRFKKMTGVYDVELEDDEEDVNFLIFCWDNFLDWWLIQWGRIFEQKTLRRRWYWGRRDWYGKNWDFFF